MGGQPPSTMGSACLMGERPHTPYLPTQVPAQPPSLRLQPESCHLFSVHHHPTATPGNQMYLVLGRSDAPPSFEQRHRIGGRGMEIPYILPRGSADGSPPPLARWTPDDRLMAATDLHPGIENGRHSFPPSASHLARPMGCRYIT